MANVDKAEKKIALLHRYPADQIKKTNAAFPHLREKGIDVLTFKKFDRLSKHKKFWKSILWVFYAPCLVFGRGYDVIYCDDSYPFYPIFVKLVSPFSKVVLRIGDFHLMYYYSGWVYHLLHYFEQLGWMMADRIVAISYEMGEKIGSEIGYKKLYLVLDPVDPKDFPIQDGKCLAGVMFHGVLTKNKNLDLMIEAAKRLPNIFFMIVGDGPDLKRLKNIASSNIHFPGWVTIKELNQLMRVCSVGVALRSDNPGNEYVVTSPFLQYGIMGKPCLVTRRRVFRNYEWQFSGVDEMVEKIKILLQKPEEGERLRKYVLENHDAQKIAEQIWKILLSV